MSSVAIFHPSAELYGADRILVNALKALPVETNKQVYLFREGPLVDFLKENVSNIEVHITPKMPVIYRAIFNPEGMVQTISNFFSYFNFVQTENKLNGFSSAYVNTSSNVLMLPILWLLRIKRFIHIHEIIDSPKAIGWFTAFMSKTFANRVVCVSHAVKHGLMRYVKGIDKVAKVIHNGIDAIEVESSESRVERMNTEGQPTAIDQRQPTKFYLFGRIQPRKGHWFLINALAKLPRHLLNSSEFVLMGGVVPGKEQDLIDLQAAIDRNGLTDFVQIKDFAKDISEPMSNADVCLVPSLVKDSFPTTVIEAMSAGRPVITTNNGGAKEAVVDGQTGYLINPNDTDKLADSIMRLLMNKAKMQEMGKAGRKRFSMLYTAKVFSRNWLEFMEKDFPMGPKKSNNVRPIDNRLPDLAAA